MTTFRRWTMPVALALGATIGAFAMQTRRKRLHRSSRLRAHRVQEWENEGGNNVEVVSPAETAKHVDSAVIL